MRRAVLLLVPVLLLACDRQPVGPDDEPTLSAANVEWEYEVVSNSGFEYPPCRDEGHSISGEAWVKRQFVENDNRLIVKVQAGPLEGYKLVGLTSGEVWLPTPGLMNGVAQTFIRIYPLGEPFQVHTIITQWKFENQTTGEVLNFPFYQHATRNAAGEFTVIHTLEPCHVH